MEAEIKTIIKSNGSRWAGDELATVDELLALMAVEPLEWDRFPNPVSLTEEGLVQLFGNFMRVSHVYNIETNDQGLLARFAIALEKNKAMEKHFDYKSPVTNRDKLAGTA